MSEKTVNNEGLKKCKRHRKTLQADTIQGIKKPTIRRLAVEVLNASQVPSTRRAAVHYSATQ
jgi:hypothetical protein